MAAYGLDIPQVVRWTYPQLRRVSRWLEERVREERRWQLTLHAPMMSEEAFDDLWESLGGEPIAHSGSSSGSPSAGRGSSSRSLPADSQGNVIAPRGTPRLDQMTETQMRLLPFPIVVRLVDGDGNPVDEIKQEENGPERRPSTPR